MCLVIRDNASLGLFDCLDYGFMDTFSDGFLKDDWVQRSYNGSIDGFEDGSDNDLLLGKRND